MLFLFRCFKAAVRGLTVSATIRPSRPARKSGLGLAAKGRFSATSLDLSLARAGHQESIATGRYLAGWSVATAAAAPERGAAA